MTRKTIDDKELSRLLQQLPERQPPNGITAGVMHKIESLPHRSSFPFLDKIHSVFQQGRRPMFAAGSICTIAIALVFALGFLFGQNSSFELQSPRISAVQEKNLPDPHTAFLEGRQFFKTGQYDKALALIQQAVTMAPENPEYLYWQGTTYWKLGNISQEEQSYLKAVHYQPDFLPALLNLGHSFLEKGDAETALIYYQRVLAIDRQHQMSLYNAALASLLAGRPQQALENWKAYLAVYRSGRWSRRALDHLIELQDFTFRDYLLGKQRLILNQKALLGTMSPEKAAEIKQIANILRQNDIAVCNIVVFNEAGSDLARKQASELKNLLHQTLGDQDSTSISISWFGESESYTTHFGTQTLKNGLLVFTSPKLSAKKEATI